MGKQQNKLPKHLYRIENLRGICSKGRRIKSEEGKLVGRGFFSKEWITAGYEKSKLKALVKQGTLLADLCPIKRHATAKVQYLTVYYMPEEILRGTQSKNKSNNLGNKPQVATHSPIIDPRTNKPYVKERDNLLHSKSTPNTPKLEPPVQKTDTEKESVGLQDNGGGDQEQSTCGTKGGSTDISPPPPKRVQQNEGTI